MLHNYGTMYVLTADRTQKGDEAPAPPPPRKRVASRFFDAPHDAPPAGGSGSSDEEPTSEVVDAPIMKAAELRRYEREQAAGLKRRDAWLAHSRSRKRRK